jgi:hypothetical protein
MRAMLVVVPLELDELPLEISRGPEQHTIQTFAPHGSNQPFDDRMKRGTYVTVLISRMVRSRTFACH